MTGNSAQALAEHEQNTRQILLVDDNADDREHIAHLIWSAYSGPDFDALVKDVATGPEAFDHFQTHDIDCVILDFRLGREDGLTILSDLKEMAPYCPVIILTGQGNERLAAKSIREGAADYLIKQKLTQDNLASAIESAISHAALEAKMSIKETEREQFLNILVHDLRAPLRNISLLGELAIEEAESGDFSELKATLTRQTNVANRAAKLITALEEYALLDRSVNMSPVSLTDIAKDACDNLAATISERRAVVDINELPTVVGHEPQLVQLFQNLIQNGLKYNDSEIPWIGIDGDCDHKEDIIFTIKDNGIGIPKKHLSTIFAPLKRLWGNGRYEGTGLGLALCQKIVDRHGGAIWCTSSESEGSEFHVLLPAISES